MSGEGCVKAKLSPCALGVSFGVLKGVSLMLFAWVSYFFGYGAPIIENVASVYSGYSASIVGGFVGGIWGLVVGFIFGMLFGYIYNYILCRCCKKCDKSAECK